VFGIPFEFKGDSFQLLVVWQSCGYRAKTRSETFGAEVERKISELSLSSVCCTEYLAATGRWYLGTWCILVKRYHANSKGQSAS